MVADAPREISKSAFSTKSLKIHHLTAMFSADILQKLKASSQ